MKTGERVKENQVLIVLDSELVKVFIEKAKANIKFFQAQQKLLEEKRLKLLTRKGLLSQGKLS